MDRCCERKKKVGDIIKCQTKIRLRQNFDFNWFFKLGDFENAHKIDFDDSDWRQINVPHDWSIEGEYKEHNPTGARGGFLPVGIGWYRKIVNIPEEWANKCIFIEFDGVYMNSDVWINGNHLGNRPYGYSSFEYDMTPYIKPGINVIAVRVDNSKAPNSRWYTGSGIYRHVWLTVTEKVHVAHWGTYVTTPNVTDKTAEVSIRTTVENAGLSNKSITLISNILDDKGNLICSTKSLEEIPGEGSQEILHSANIDKPALWSPETPNLYSVYTLIKEEDKVIDDYKTTFGVRYFNFDSNTGFTLNGKSMKFKGVCNHHDAGPVGAAVPDKVLERRLRILKDMGCNAIRTSHNPMAPEFYDMCDRMGFMVMDEAFDVWEESKSPFDYSIYFEKWWKKDLGDMIRRDRNHPSVILWSIGNEIRNMNVETTKKLVDFCHKEDPTRPVTCGVNSIEESQYENRHYLDVAGYNDGGGACFIFEMDHKNDPQRKFIATEKPHTLQTRGFYRTQTWWRDKDKARLEIDNLTEEEIFFDGALQYNSSYDNSGVRLCARDSWRQTRDLPYLTGEFRWTGFDYIGESRGWPARMGNYGIIDICGFSKDHYYFYQSQWTEKPMVHLLPHWTHPGMDGVTIPVWVYTNCDSVELFINGKSLGEKKVGDRMNLSWDVPYTPGTLRAVAKKSGEIVAVNEVKTASYPTYIKLHVDNSNLKNDGVDISHVVFEIVDKEGNFVPNADDMVMFHIQGPVKNLGMDNGDPLDLTPHKVNYRKAFNGLGLGIFQSTLEEGDISIVAAGILGDNFFEGSTIVSIDVARVNLRGALPDKEYTIYYTTDGTEPNKQALAYEKPFEIKESCVIRAAVYEDEEKIMDISAVFEKDIRGKVIDLTHGNGQKRRSNGPQGPFDELIGAWREGDSLFIFKDDGTVIEMNSIKKPSRRVGCWWYDSSATSLSEEEHVGAGELWWDNGEISKLKLDSRDSRVLCVDKIGQSQTFIKSKL